jgi:hypothetical protein
MNERTNPVSKHEYAVFTVCNLAYLTKALVLAESVWRHDGIQMTIILFDRKVPLANVKTQAILRWIEDMDVPAFERLAFRYDIVELSTSIKPFLALQLIETAEKVIFLDPDICTYAPLTPIVRDLDSHPIVLTPHYTVPQSDDESESDIGMMRFGSFNLGFFGLKRSEETLDFLRWWWARCFKLSYFETQFGLSTDQKWVTIAPCFFPDLHVSFDLGYNVAPWNTYERRITRGADGMYIVNERFPLIFFHFSNFDPSDLGYLNKRSFRDRGVIRPDIEDLGRAYDSALATQRTELASVPYAFDYMSGGEYISPTLRRAYAAIESELPAGHDPFDSRAVVGEFARRNYLFEKAGAPRYKTQGFREMPRYQRSLKYLYSFMRLVLRVVGPNRFYNLSRLLVYLSSYRQNRGLWKY